MGEVREVLGAIKIAEAIQKAPGGRAPEVLVRALGKTPDRQTGEK